MWEIFRKGQTKEFTFQFKIVSKTRKELSFYFKIHHPKFIIWRKCDREHLSRFMQYLIYFHFSTFLKQWILFRKWNYHPHTMYQRKQNKTNILFSKTVYQSHNHFKPSVNHFLFFTRKYHKQNDNIYILHNLNLLFNNNKIKSVLLFGQIYQRFNGKSAAFFFGFFTEKIKSEERIIFYWTLK